MRNYEIMFIVRTDIEENAQKEVIKTLENALTKNSAKITSSKELGQKELAYEINKHKTGYYYLYNVEAKDDKGINEFKRLSDINENVIRALVINLDK